MHATKTPLNFQFCGLSGAPCSGRQCLPIRIERTVSRAGRARQTLAPKVPVLAERALRMKLC